jgi:thiamine-monophosphate kinase
MILLAKNTVAEIGEKDLLRLIQKLCVSEIVGDDGAIVTLKSQQKLVITTDVLVENVHFSPLTTPPRSVGWRAVAANLSDLAAMGADPVGITVGLGVPGTCLVEWILEVYEGMNACLQQSQSLPVGANLQGIVGGDVCRAPVATLAITAFGSGDPRYLLTRSALQVGDQLVVTGYHGASRAGLAVLQAQSGENPAAAALWIEAHQFPQPRLEVLPVLRGLQDLLDRPLGAMDSSDGLADAVLQLCQASGVGARLWRHRLPLPPGLTEWVGEVQGVDWCLYGGEDFELVLGLPPQCLELFLNQVPQAHWIGEVIAEPRVSLDDGTQLEMGETFQHF